MPTLLAYIGQVVYGLSGFQIYVFVELTLIAAGFVWVTCDY